MEQWHKQSATVSANLVEICDSLGNLDLCVLHLKRTMGIVNITLRWHGRHSAEVNENINLGYSQDQGYS